MRFLSCIKYLRGYLCIHLTGYAPERFLNMCGKRNILIWNLYAVEDGYRFCISVDAFRELKPILKKTKTKVVILEKKGLPFHIFRYRKRKLFALGILIFWCAITYVSGFVWNIEIVGNSYLSQETILRFLESEGAGYGIRISQIDCATLEEELRSAYPEVIWTSIKIYGTKLTVEVQESLLSENAYEESVKDVNDIVASKDGKIIHMITRHGNPLVHQGDEVEQGKCLVSGAVPIVSDYGDITEYLYECADADIIAEVTYNYQSNFEKQYREKAFEEVCVTYEIQLGDMKVWNPFFKEPEDTYDTMVEMEQCCLGEDYYIPVYLRRISYYPYTWIEKEYTDEEAKEVAEKDFLQYMRKMEEKGIQIIEKNVMIKRVNQNYQITGTILAEESIVSYRKTEIHNMNLEGQTENEFD